MQLVIKYFSLIQKTFKKSALIPSMPGDLPFFIFFNTFASSLTVITWPRSGSSFKGWKYFLSLYLYHNFEISYYKIFVFHSELSVAQL